jgi:glycosyltransferase involved in cell wall biosynthesis
VPDALRVCFLIRSLDQGGAERQLIEILTGLDKRAFDVTLIVFYAGGAFWREAAAIEGVRVVSLGKSRRWDPAPFFVRLPREVRRWRPDVIYGWLNIANELALVAGRLAGARVMWRLGAAFMDLRQYDWLPRASFRASAWLSRWPDLIVVNSHEGRRYHGSRGYATDRMRVVTNGFDLERFRPDPAAGAAVRREWGIGAGQRLVGLAARLDPIKDHPTFLRAAAALAATDASVRFVCVGGGPDGYAAGLRALAASLGLEGRLTWAGARHDMPAVYNALDVASLCSRGEGPPNTVGEAMACGVPCVVTDVGDTRLLVGDTGVVVAPGAPEALAGGWRTLLALDDEARQAMGRGARARIAAGYTLDRLVGETADALRAAYGRAPLDREGAA